MINVFTIGIIRKLYHGCLFLRVALHDGEARQFSIIRETSMSPWNYLGEMFPEWETVQRWTVSSACRRTCLVILAYMYVMPRDFVVVNFSDCSG